MVWKHFVLYAVGVPGCSLVTNPGCLFFAMVAASVGQWLAAATAAFLAKRHSAILLSHCCCGAHTPCFITQPADHTRPAHDTRPARHARPCTRPAGHAAASAAAAAAAGAVAAVVSAAGPAAAGLRRRMTRRGEVPRCTRQSREGTAWGNHVSSAAAVLPVSHACFQCLVEAVPCHVQGQ